VPTPILVGCDPRTSDVAPVARVGDPVAVLVEMSSDLGGEPVESGVSKMRTSHLDRGCGADGYSASEQSTNKDARGQVTVEEISDVKANVTVQLSDHPSD
jgi:hypothetical protein